MGISIITPTGDRHLALRQLASYLRRQTFTGDVQWIIVDDGKIPYCPHAHDAKLVDCANFELTYVRRVEPDVAGGSLNRNLIVGLRQVRYEHVAIMEDDDWYDPSYLETVVKHLRRVDLFGESGSLYYNVRTRRWRKLSDRSHASLCQTSFKSSLISKIDECCRSSTPFVDLNIWKLGVRKHLQPFFNGCVGIKGMPGRGGYGVGHRDGFGDWVDGNLMKLASLVGRDARFYAQFAELRIPTWREWVETLSTPVSRALVLGKGPTLDYGLDADWSSVDLVVGLNHACRERAVDVAHAIDIDVVTDLGDTLLEQCSVLVMPWHPHLGFRHSSKTLYEYARETPVLRSLCEQGRLVTYYASLHEKYRTRPSSESVVNVRAFSAEAVVDLLTSIGCREVLTAGVDGGVGYSTRLADLRPLENSQPSFDAQWAGIRRTSRMRSSRVVPLVETKVLEPPLAIVHVPKCAGTAIRRSLEPHLQPTMYARALRDEAPRLVYGHSTATELRELFPRCRLVTCLRDPVERVVSLYRYWMSKSRAYAKAGEPYTDPRHADFVSRGGTVEELAELLPTTMQDFVGDVSRFELVMFQDTLEQDWPQLLEVAQLPQDVPLLRENVTPSDEPVPSYDEEYVRRLLASEIEFYESTKNRRK